MKGNRFSLICKLALVYVLLALILDLAFHIDITSWWAGPLYERGLAFFRGMAGFISYWVGASLDGMV